MKALAMMQYNLHDVLSIFLVCELSDVASVIYQIHAHTIPLLVFQTPIQGFIQMGGGTGIPSPREILKLSMVIIVASMHCLASLSQIASEAI